MNRLTRFGLPFLFCWGLNACGTTASSEDVAVAPEPEVIEPVEETADPVQADEEPEESDVEVVSNMDEAPSDNVAEESVDDVQAEEVPAEESTVADATETAPEESAATTESTSGPIDAPPSATDLYWASMGQLNADLDYESALETAEKLVESDTTGFAKFDVAVLKDRKGEADEALRLLDEVIAASVPASIPALDAKLSVLTRQNRGLELESYLRENWKDTVETIPYAAILGRLLLDQGQLEEVFKLSLAILRLQEKSAPALALIGRYYIRKENSELAKVALRDSIAISDTSDIVHYELGMLYLKEEQLRWALNEFEAAALLAPHVPEYRNNLGVIQTELGAFLGAITNLEAAVKLEPSHAGYHLNLGTAYRGDQRFLDAKNFYDKALELEATLFDAHFQSGHFTHGK